MPNTRSGGVVRRRLCLAALLSAAAAAAPAGAQPSWRRLIDIPGDGILAIGPDRSVVGQVFTAPAGIERRLGAFYFWLGGEPTPISAWLFAWDPAAFRPVGAPLFAMHGSFPVPPADLALPDPLRAFGFITRHIDLAPGGTYVALVATVGSAVPGTLLLNYSAVAGDAYPLGTAVGIDGATPPAEWALHRWTDAGLDLRFQADFTTLVPEPGALPLAVAGALVLWLGARRRGAALPSLGEPGGGAGSSRRRSTGRPVRARLQVVLAAGVLTAIGATTWPAPLRAQPRGHAGHGAAAVPAAREGSERLGELRFPTSAAPAARATFERGVLYLHNFHYPQAVRTFREARTQDAADAMSAAFEALAYTRPVWNQQDTAAARAALRALAPTREARAAMARTPRERAWLDAVETLYDGATPKAVRDTAFSRAMARLHAADPRDPEAATFYALSLLGLNQGDRDPHAYAAAEAVVDSVLRAHPRHPGALHYKIHAVDDPVHAERGLDAARVYAEAAPDAGHAQHMTSHIFIARGMWDDVVHANRRSHAAYNRGGRVFGHGTHWLSYALLQQGRAGEARAWADSMLAYQRDVAAGAPAARGRTDVDAHAVFLTATWVVDAEAWDSPLARLRHDTTHLPGVAERTMADFLVGYAAARRAGRPVDVTPGSRAADRLLADSMLARMAERHARARAATAARPRATKLGHAEVMELVLRAELASGAGRADSALALLRVAAERLEALPFAYGPPAVVKPPRERAGEIHLAARRHAAALAEFDAADRLAPGRMQVALRRARALAALGRREEAARVYRSLAATWRHADPTFPWAAEARWGAGEGFAAERAAAVVIDTVTYAGDTPEAPLRLRGEIVRPLGAGRRPGIVLLHGSGVWAQLDVELVGRLLAARGYVAFFPYRHGQGLSAGVGEAITEQLRREGLLARDSAYAARSTELLTTTQLAEVRAAIAALRARPDVDPARVAVTGASYGGLLTLLAAEADSTLRAAVAFTPAAMNWGWNAPMRERLVDAARATRVPTLLVQAENDWHLGPSRELPAVMRASGAHVEVRVYPAFGYNAMNGHALMVLAPHVWRDDVLAFLDRHVRGVP